MGRRSAQLRMKNSARPFMNKNVPQITSENVRHLVVMRSVVKSLRNLATKFQDSPVLRFQRKTVKMFRGRAVTRFLKRPATKFPGRAASRSPRRHVVRFQGRAAHRFQRRPATRFHESSVSRSPSRHVVRFPERAASRFLEKSALQFHWRTASMYLYRSKSPGKCAKVVISVSTVLL